MKTSEKYLVETHKLAFKMKVRWFKDILRHPPARQHLWSLYYAGEAYEELHPDGVFVVKMPLGSILQKQLAKHLADETRHATIFRDLLSEEGLVPAPLEPHEDIGWYLLTRVVPDVLTRASEASSFDNETIIRYMAFLHTLELRSIGDICALIKAARDLGQYNLIKRLESILPDERFHATYTHRAVFALSQNTDHAHKVLEEIRRAEQANMSTAIFKLSPSSETYWTGTRG